MAIFDSGNTPQFYQSCKKIEHKITDRIKVKQPTLDSICEFGEQEYYGMATSLCSSPSAYKVALWDMGIDYTTISDFDFFIMMTQNLPQSMTAPLLGDLDLTSLRVAINDETEEKMLCDADENGEPQVVIDRAIFMFLTDYLRKMHGFEKKVEIPADEYTKKYLIDKERKRIKRQRNTPFKSMLKPLISSMVNQQGFKYDYDTVWDLSISVFNESITKTQKFLHYMQTMQGCYSGSISIEKINMNELNWLN